MQAAAPVTNQNELAALALFADLKGSGIKGASDSSAPAPALPDFLLLLEHASGDSAPPEPQRKQKHEANNAFYVLVLQALPLNAPLTLQFDISRREDSKADDPARPACAPEGSGPITTRSGLTGLADHFAFAAQVTIATGETPQGAEPVSRLTAGSAKDLTWQELIQGPADGNPVPPQDVRATTPGPAIRIEQNSATAPPAAADHEHDSTAANQQQASKTGQRSDLVVNPMANRGQDEQPAPQRRAATEHLAAEHMTAEHADRPENNTAGAAAGTTQHHSASFSFSEHSGGYTQGSTPAGSKAAVVQHTPALHPTEVLGQGATPGAAGPAAKIISLELGTDVAARVVLRVAERGDGIAVAVRSNGSELSQSLKDNVQNLVQSLERKGMNTEVWTPHAGGSSGSTFQENSAGQRTQHFDKGDPRGGQGQPEHQEQRGRKHQYPRWLEELEEAAPGLSSARSQA